MSDSAHHEVKVTNKRVLDEESLAAEPSQEDATPEDTSSEVDTARAEAAQHLDDLRRVQAEFENYRKRVLKEQTALAERASGGVVERILPVLDDFELALMAADRTKDYESMVRGVELVYSKLREVLEKEGLERIDVLEKRFDPELHEAVMHSEGDGEELVVVDEMRPGYKLGGRVLRPAMVKVARGKATG
ncbi:MAG: nucleotide exchange factor GrpE [Actinomycetota bacterium]